MNVWSPIVHFATDLIQYLLLLLLELLHRIFQIDLHFCNPFFKLCAFLFVLSFILLLLGKHLYPALLWFQIYVSFELSLQIIYLLMSLFNDSVELRSLLFIGSESRISEQIFALFEILINFYSVLIDKIKTLDHFFNLFMKGLDITIQSDLRLCHIFIIGYSIFFYLFCVKT
jgi:hypothetical protein